MTIDFAWLCDACEHSEPAEDPGDYAEGDTEPCVHCHGGTSRLIRRNVQPNTICDTEIACACSDSGEECCCFWNRVGRCVACGAQKTVIDFETGEELPS